MEGFVCFKKFVCIYLSIIVWIVCIMTEYVMLILYFPGYISFFLVSQCSLFVFSPWLTKLPCFNILCFFFFQVIKAISIIDILENTKQYTEEKSCPSLNGPKWPILEFDVFFFFFKKFLCIYHLDSIYSGSTAVQCSVTSDSLRPHKL